MASTAIAKGRDGAAAGVTEEAKADWWLRFNNGVPADDADAADSGDEAEGAGGGAGGKASASRVAAAGDEEAEMGSGDGRGAKAELVAHGGAKAKAEAGPGEKRRSSPRLAGHADLDEEISGGSYVLPGELPRRKRKAIAKRSKLKGDGVEVQKDISQEVYGENENLRLQLALKTSELKQEENRRLKLELLLKAKEMESLQKENEELKAENEQLRKNAKPERVRRLCRSCNTHVFHDYRNCPKRRQASSSPGEEDAVDAY